MPTAHGVTDLSAELDVLHRGEVEQGLDAVRCHDGLMRGQIGCELAQRDGGVVLTLRILGQRQMHNSRHTVHDD